VYNNISVISWQLAFNGGGNFFIISFIGGGNQNTENHRIDAGY